MMKRVINIMLRLSLDIVRVSHSVRLSMTAAKARKRVDVDAILWLRCH